MRYRGLGSGLRYIFYYKGRVKNMKIKINADELRKTAADMDFIMKGNKTKTLDSLLITAKNDVITLIVNNSSIQAEKTLSGKIITEGSVLISRDDLGVILKMKGDVELEFSGNQCSVKGKRLFKFTVENSADDFLLMPDIPENEPDFAIAEKDLLYCMKLKKSIANPDTIKQQLRGIWIDKNNILACDTQKLSKIEITSETSQKFMIPDFALDYLAKALNEKSSSLVDFYISENGYIKARSDNFVITFGQYKGDFPDYEKLLQDNAVKKIIVKKQDLSETINFVCDVSKSNKGGKTRSEPVVYRFYDKVFKLDYSFSGKHTEEDIPFTVLENDGAELTIGFNPFYVSEILSMTNGENITMSFNSPLTPSVIHDENETEKYLLISARVKDAA
jgi:DNA polymerase III sliding clamp (beta) subunit (PCNA family)